ncbi:MAG: S-layer homology domain-containing protein [Firmicutes bacterium]|nr:S-layer homology domain-containing protein [Bacillota bacterium]
MKKLLSTVMVLCLILGLAPAAMAENSGEVHRIVLKTKEEDGAYTSEALIDGKPVEYFEYVWHADPSQAHEDVKNSPAEYYTGEKPVTDAAAYIARDIEYWPLLDTSGFVKESYNKKVEWCYYFTAAEYSDYIFATLPIIGNKRADWMMHSPEEAYQNAVLHITRPGTYEISGKWHGQINIDLGDSDETFTDENAGVTLILNGVEAECTVAPVLIFKSAYECDNTWEEREEHGPAVDTSGAGANLIIADGSVNELSGANVYRMLKTKYKDASKQRTDSVTVQKKARKIDGAVYSYVSMNIDGQEKGDGILNIRAKYEGLDSELHLTVNGGRLNIFSDDDGVNVNEDDVSVFTVNDGRLHILAGLGYDGDGVDSNGYVVINGGTVISTANPRVDSGLDSPLGTYINGGTVVALGSTMDYAAFDDYAESGQATMNLRFSEMRNDDDAIIVTDSAGKVVFAYDPDRDEVISALKRKFKGAIISDPNMLIGGHYDLYIGGTVAGSETEGVYDSATVTGLNGCKLQCYDVNMTLKAHSLFARKSSNKLYSIDFSAEKKVNNFSGVTDWDGSKPMQEETAEVRTMSFKDVSSKDWFYEDVQFAYDAGLMEGSSAEVFDPRRPTTRAMIVTMLHRMEGSPQTEAGQPFSDVPEGSYYRMPVIWAAENGIVDGYGDWTFRPDREITREQLAAIMYRYAAYKGYDLDEEGDLSAFADKDEISSYALNAMSWANGSGLINGHSDTVLAPKGTTLRSQAAAVFRRFAEKYMTNDLN